VTLKFLDVLPGWKAVIGIIGLVAVHLFGGNVSPETQDTLQRVFEWLTIFGVGAKVGASRPVLGAAKQTTQILLVVLALGLTACACDVERLAAEQNVRNVESLAADTARWAPSAEKESVLDRNREAIDLAKRLVPKE
jgi:hypothetical protein